MSTEPGRRSGTGLIAFGGGVTAACYDIRLMLVVAVLGALIYFGVLWPAIWSRAAHRRSAALVVLDRLLRAAGRDRP